MRRPIWIILLAGLAMESSAGAAENDEPWWPQFRGPNSSGIGEGSPPVHFGPTQNVLWRSAVGSGSSSPIIWSRRIFLTEADRATRELSTVCLDRDTGKILWRRAVQADELEEVHELSSPAGATPATDGEQLYVYF